MKPKAFLKKVFFRIGWIVVERLPETRFTRDVRHRLHLKHLARKDGPGAAAVEFARQYGVKVGENCRIYLGQDTFWYGPEPYLIEIGDNVLISGHVQFLTHDGAVYLFRDEETDIVGHYGKIKIGNNCFVGCGAIFMPNVQLGDNCIVCAGAVVAESFPDNSVIMGNPARRIMTTQLYKSMKLSSVNTVRNSECSFPESDLLPFDVRKKIILDGVDEIPIRVPRRSRKRAGRPERG